jgi:hypothetical protein
MNIDQIRAILLREWDPLDVRDNPNLSDEYDAYLAKVAELIRNGSTASEIADHLKRIEESLGSSPPSERRTRAAVALEHLARA